MDLEPLTVIVGPNSCGKSTLLDGINRVLKLKLNPLKRMFLSKEESFDVNKIYSPEAFLNWKLGVRQSMEMRLLGDKYNIDLSFYKSETRNKWMVKGLDGLGLLDGNENMSYSELRDQEVYLMMMADDVFLCSPSVSRISAASYSPLEIPILESNGSGLATIISGIINDSPEDFINIQNFIKMVIPNIVKIKIRREKIKSDNWFNKEYINKFPESVIGDKLIIDFKESKDIRAEYASEGTLISIFLITCMFLFKGPGIILVDDIDRALHPKAIKDLFSAIREIQKLNPELQIIATTHSPYLLDHLKPEEVRIATLDPERGTVIAKLTDHPEFEKWKEVMAPGEFWSYAGEDWVLKRNQESHE